MKLFSTKATLKRHMESIVKGSFAQAEKEGRIRQGPSGKWFEWWPPQSALPNKEYLNRQRGDASLSSVRVNFLVYRGSWEDQKAEDAPR